MKLIWQDECPSDGEWYLLRFYRNQRPHDWHLVLCNEMYAEWCRDNPDDRQFAGPIEVRENDYDDIPF
jgi:hypothetical protein